MNADPKVMFTTEDLWAELDRQMLQSQKLPEDISAKDIAARYKVSVTTALTKLHEMAKHPGYVEMLVRTNSRGNHEWIIRRV